MSETTRADPMLSDVEAFLEAQSMTATAFGWAALNDPTFVHELRKGRDCKWSTRERIYKYIETAQRAGLAG